jgi:hypothetical protein
MSIAFAEQRTTIEKQNVYGGKTILITLDEEEQLRYRVLQIIDYFDSENNITKRIYTNTESVSNENGVKEQIEYYTDNIVTKYEMSFTDDYYNINGYNRLIEEVSADDIVTRKIWYKDETLLDISAPATEKFVFYHIDFIHDEFFTDYEPNPNGDAIDYSAKYFSLRSLIQFDTEMIELDESDIMLMNYFSAAYGLENFTPLYSKKVRAYSENNSYWLYVQKDLEPFVLGQYVTARYYPIGKNGELYLICVGFYDVDM